MSNPVMVVLVPAYLIHSLTIIALNTCLGCEDEKWRYWYRFLALFREGSLSFYK